MSGEENELNRTQYESAIRKREYKHLLDVGGAAMENIEANSVADNFATLKDLLIKSNELSDQGTLMDRVGQTAEVVLDAQVCKLVSDLLGNTVQKIVNDEFSDELFANALLERFTNEVNVCDWAELDGTAAATARSFSSSASLFGTFHFDQVPEVNPATQKQRRQRRKNELAVETRPTTVQETEQTQSALTKVEMVLDQIKDNYVKTGKKPIPYYKLIIDPANMMYTFDNAFQVSFLFRDGCIAFVKDDEGMPAIKPLNQNNKPPKPAENASFTSTLNMGIINKYIAKYNIRKAMLVLPRD